MRVLVCGIFSAWIVSPWNQPTFDNQTHKLTLCATQQHQTSRSHSAENISNDAHQPHAVCDDAYSHSTHSKCHPNCIVFLALSYVICIWMICEKRHHIYIYTWFRGNFRAHFHRPYDEDNGVNSPNADSPRISACGSKLCRTFETMFKYYKCVWCVWMSCVGYTTTISSAYICECIVRYDGAANLHTNTDSEVLFMM